MRVNPARSQGSRGNASQCRHPLAPPSAMLQHAGIASIQAVALLQVQEDVASANLNVGACGIPAARFVRNARANVDLQITIRILTIAVTSRPATRLGILSSEISLHLTPADQRIMSEFHGNLTDYSVDVWRTSYRLLGNAGDASECSQQTIADALRIDPTSVRSWRAVLCRIATRRAMDLLRRRYREQEVILRLDKEPGIDDPPNVDMEYDELCQQVRKALVALSANQVPLCANMRETTLNFIRVEGMEHSHDRYRQQKN
ncbi:RNA polymerase sigma factor [Rubripirellula lacrimiformis]|uniref:RNA polymerase sigma factor n=2 Tax=Rubripirellula lacrimiformis TaxID=1930273 RepID=A0A517N3N0_9BACT|nr:RNA polymerase sigma factor [Rubripirellula lacrimiformis]